MVQGRKNSHSMNVVKLAARAGSEFHSDTSRRRVLSVLWAKGECAYFTLLFEYLLFRTCITYYFQYRHLGGGGGGGGGAGSGTARGRRASLVIVFYTESQSLSDSKEVRVDYGQLSSSGNSGIPVN